MAAAECPDLGRVPGAADWVGLSGEAILPNHPGPIRHRSGTGAGPGRGGRSTGAPWRWPTGVGRSEIHAVAIEGDAETAHVLMGLVGRDVER